MDDEEITSSDIEALMPDEVKMVLAEEMAFIIEAVRKRRASGESVIQSALTWLPYVGAIFEENEASARDVMEDIGLDTRVQIVVAKIQAKFGDVELSKATIDGFRRIIGDMYSTNVDI
jgi:hypothetical protein